MFGFSNEIVKAAQHIWDYMQLRQELKPCDILLLLGSRDERTATWAASLYRQNFTRRIAVSGGASSKNDNHKSWGTKSEAEHFSSIMIDHGVPRSKILLERYAQNTGQNIAFTHKLLQDSHISFNSILLVQKPYMERRTFATCMKQWPGADLLDHVIVSSPPVGMKDYFANAQDFREHVSLMVGDLERIIEYPKRGYQISQEVPKSVKAAALFLRNSGFNKHSLQH